ARPGLEAGLAGRRVHRGGTARRHVEVVDGDFLLVRLADPDSYRLPVPLGEGQPLVVDVQRGALLAVHQLPTEAGRRSRLNVDDGRDRHRVVVQVQSLVFRRVRNVVQPVRGDADHLLAGG